MICTVYIIYYYYYDNLRVMNWRQNYNYHVVLFKLQRILHKTGLRHIYNPIKIKNFYFFYIETKMPKIIQLLFKYVRNFHNVLCMSWRRGIYNIFRPSTPEFEFRQNFLFSVRQQRLEDTICVVLQRNAYKKRSLHVFLYCIFLSFILTCQSNINVYNFQLSFLVMYYGGGGSQVLTSHNQKEF